MDAFLTAFLSGFLTCAALIVAIGAQNMFVLRQGLCRNHVTAVVMFCGCADTALVAAGVAGAGSVLFLVPRLATGLTLGGGAFLAWYGATALGRAVRSESLSVAQQPVLPLGRTLAITAALTFLNPHVYLDTLLLMGATGASHPPAARPFFVAGASAASFGWFALIGFGARGLTRFFAKPVTWRILDTLVGGTMLVLAAHLFLGAAGR